jgi:hypothetical protein
MVVNGSWLMWLNNAINAPSPSHRHEIMGAIRTIKNPSHHHEIMGAMKKTIKHDKPSPF